MPHTSWCAGQHGRVTTESCQSRTRPSCTLQMLGSAYLGLSAFASGTGCPMGLKHHMMFGRIKAVVANTEGHNQQLWQSSTLLPGGWTRGCLPNVLHISHAPHAQLISYRLLQHLCMSCKRNVHSASQNGMLPMFVANTLLPEWGLHCCCWQPVGVWSRCLGMQYATQLLHLW